MTVTRERVNGEWRDVVAEERRHEKCKAFENWLREHNDVHADETQHDLLLRIGFYAGYDIEIIPRRERHYGVWVPGEKELSNGKGGWIEFSNGAMFSTTSIGAAKAQLNLSVGDFPGKGVRVINDDGTPGEVV